ncbi:MAG: hypothetical protein WCK35_18870 [Chloroflexota bacterium]
MEKETRTASIEWRVFSKADILRIAKVFHKEYLTAKKNNHHTTLSYQLSYEAGGSYESDSLNIFENDGRLDIKTIKRIRMVFNDYEAEHYIEISLRAGDYDGDLFVKGANRNWVQGNFTTLQEIFDSVKPQSQTVIKNRNAIFHIIAISAGLIFYNVISIVVRYLMPSITIDSSSNFILKFLSENPWVTYVFNFLSFWYNGAILVAVPVSKILVELWPKIEFDFGPEHLNKIKLRRQLISIIMSVIIIPIVLNIITNFLL